MYAPLHPVFTPSMGRPNALPAKGVPALRTRSNAFRAGGGSRIHGLPGVSSKRRASVLTDHRTTRSRSRTLASQRGWAVAGDGVLFRETRSDGYTAASNCAGDSARSSRATSSVRSNSSCRTPPPARDRHNFDGRSSAIVPPGRRSSHERSTKRADMSI